MPRVAFRLVKKFEVGQRAAFRKRPYIRGTVTRCSETGVKVKWDEPLSSGLRFSWERIEELYLVE